MEILPNIPKKYRKAIEFFADRLISKQMQKHLVLRIIQTKHAENYGETEVIGYNLGDKPREFGIILKRDIPEEEKIRTLAHELCHIKQILYNELNETMSLWRGQKVSEDDYDNYYDQPWEAEAYMMENKLYEEYTNATRNTR